MFVGYIFNEGDQIVAKVGLIKPFITLEKCRKRLKEELVNFIHERGINYRDAYNLRGIIYEVDPNDHSTTPVDTVMLLEEDADHDADFDEDEEEEDENEDENLDDQPEVEIPDPFVEINQANMRQAVANANAALNRAQNQARAQAIPVPNDDWIQYVPDNNGGIRAQLRADAIHWNNIQELRGRR